MIRSYHPIGGALKRKGRADITTPAPPAPVTTVTTTSVLTTTTTRVTRN